jgi:hypothetical protein
VRNSVAFCEGRTDIEDVSESGAKKSVTQEEDGENYVLRSFMCSSTNVSRIT